MREKAGGEAMSIEEYLERNGYSDEFRDDYLIVRMMNGSAENTSDGLISSR